MSKKQKRVLLFDFDGVIVDTFDLCLGINRKLGSSSLSADDYRKRFEGNIYKHFEKQNIDIEQTDNAFFKHYNPELLQFNPVEGIQEVIKELRKRYTLVIISSTINSPIQAHLEKYNLAQYFDKIFGSDVHRSKIEKIKMVFEQYNVQPKNCIFITDTLGDMREAEATGVRAIGVTWGYHSLETLQRGNPVAIVHKPENIVSAVNEYFTHN
ncbi:MAG: HAD family hydrolase [Patescibacteria group bacterium]|nr:HAD family hydrolase [Patescibacteria group bacterium]